MSKKPPAIFDDETPKTNNETSGIPVAHHVRENERTSSRSRFATIKEAPRTMRSDMQNASEVKVPQEVEKVFNTLGWNIRWVSVVDAKTKGPTNDRINYHRAMGGEFVTASMLKELGDVALPLLYRLTNGQYREEFADSRNDEMEMLKHESLVLMMIPSVVRKQRQKQAETEIIEKLRTTQRQYGSDGGSKMAFNTTYFNRPDTNYNKE